MDRAAIIKALRDTAQSASNTIAGNVSGPVDLIAAGLRGMGVPVPQNAVGGSQWMAQKGLTAPVQQGASQVVGDTLGMVGPMAAVQFAPQIARAMNQGAANLAAPRTLNPQTGAIVWHGSPHKFDAFDAQKIGTGEGSQMYGHGLYLADEPAVAKQYAAIASKPGLRQGTSVGSDQAMLDGLIKMNARKYTGGDVQKLSELIQSRPGAFSQPERMLQRLSEFVDNNPPGYLYKVDLPDQKIAQMLDWDAPLEKQSQAIQDAVKKAIEGTPFAPPKTGKEAYNFLAARNAKRFGVYDTGKESQAGAMALREANIPGIRYLDQMSRNEGAGTSNFVVFPGNEDILKILERNGQPLGLMGVR